MCWCFFAVLVSSGNDSYKKIRWGKFRLGTGWKLGYDWSQSQAGWRFTMVFIFIWVKILSRGSRFKAGWFIAKTANFDAPAKKDTTTTQLPLLLNVSKAFTCYSYQFTQIPSINQILKLTGAPETESFPTPCVSLWTLLLTLCILNGAPLIWDYTKPDADVQDFIGHVGTVLVHLIWKDI